MSDRPSLDFASDDAAAVSREAGALLAAGGSAAVADAVLRELAGPEAWRRSVALDRLLKLEGAADLLEHFVKALSDPAHADRRSGARSALSALASPDSPICEAAIDALCRLVLEDPDNDVRLLAAAAVGESENARGREALERALSDPDANVASAAAESLGLLEDRRAVGPLVGAAASGPFWVRVAAILALGRLGDERALEPLGEWVGEAPLAAAVATAIGEIGSADGLTLLRTALGLGGEARRAARTAVARIFAHASNPEVDAWLREEMAKDVGELIVELERDEDSAARLLGIAATPAAIAALLELLEDRDRRPSALLGLESLPAGPRAHVALERLERATAEGRVVLLEALPPLRENAQIRTVARFLGEADARVRAAAAEALGRSDAAGVLAVLDDEVRRPEMRLGAALTYGHLGTARCEPLLGLLADQDPAVRASAAQSLGRCSEVDAETVSTALLTELDPAAREAMLGALGAIGGAGAVATLRAGLASDQPATRFAAARALGLTRAPEALAPLLEALGDADADVRVAALIGLGDLGDHRASSAVAAWMREGTLDVRRTAARSLDQLAASDGWQVLIEALGDADAQVRRTAAETLCRIGVASALPALRAHAETESSAGVREAVTRAIVEIEERHGASANE